MRAAVGLLQLCDVNHRAPFIDTVKDDLLSEVCVPRDFHVLREWLAPYHETLINEFRKKLKESNSESEILRTASFLAQFDPALEAQQWTAGAGRINDKVTRALLSSDPAIVSYWIDDLRPVRSALVGPLMRLNEDTANSANMTETQRIIAAHAIVEYVDEPRTLAQQLIRAAPFQFDVFYEGLTRRFPRSTPQLAEVFRNVLSGAPTSDDMRDEASRDQFAIRQVMAAIALLRLTSLGDDIRTILVPRDDPRAASYFIDYVAPCGVDPNVLLECYHNEADPRYSPHLASLLGEVRGLNAGERARETGPGVSEGLPRGP